MKSLLRSFLLTLLFVSSASTLFAGELKLALANGRVTLIAQDVTIRQILDEWARVGQTRIVNGDKLSGPAVTLQLVDVPEAQALETLLRSASGYVAAQRASYVPGTSVFDRVMILPTSRPPAVSAAPPPAFNQPTRQMMQPQPVPDADDDPEDAPVVMPPGMQPPGGLHPPLGPEPGTQQQQQPLTAPRPGMLPQPGAQPQTTPGGPPTQTRPGGRGGGPGGGPGGAGGGPGGAEGF